MPTCFNDWQARHARSEAIQLVACSPDERSDIRGGVRVVPGCRCAHPGYDLNTTSHSRDALRPRFLHLLSALFEIEGAGKTGCLLHPRSRVRFAQTKGHTSIQGSGSIPAFPAQWLYGLLRALPGERLFCLRRRRDRSRRLNASTAAPEPHDFTVRSSHTRQLRLSRPSHLTARS
jgi:hypothetical protein